MTFLITLIFIIGYTCIAFEHKLKIDKASFALLTGVICWLLFYLGVHSPDETDKVLLESLGEISAILFFLLGAMTIVEVIDTHHGFDIIARQINTRSKGILLTIVSFLTFFLSAVLDNLTTSIVMVSLCRKLLSDKNDRLWFASMIIIAANAGGAWSPIGDVTTTMLWIGEQVTAANIIVRTFIPSLMVILVPLGIVLLRFRNQRIPEMELKTSGNGVEDKIFLFSGLALLIFVPVFKTLTHMPPFMGMLFALGIMWIINSLIHIRKHYEERTRLSVASAIRKIDTSSILFFLGILLAVSALQAAGILGHVAEFTASHLKNMFVTGTLLGLLSAVIDNVPLVAAAQGMFSLEMYPTDHTFWEFLALSAGTGGSAVIFGSAAGVAIMGIEKIEFFWFIKHISLLALAGFFAGLLTYPLQLQLVG